jgi:hypothetical protein
VSEHTTDEERSLDQWLLAAHSNAQGFCVRCGQVWPCEVSRLLAERDAQAKRLADLHEKAAEIPELTRRAEKAGAEVKELEAFVSWLGVGEFGRDGEGWIVRWDRPLAEPR